MKKTIFVSILLLLLFSLPACSSAKASGNSTAPSTSPSSIPSATQGNKLTLEEIEKSYIYGEIVTIVRYKTDYVLYEIKSENPGDPTRFELYNLRTGDVDVLPTLPYYAKLIEFRSENDIVFETTGVNSVTGSKDFPFTIECRRNAENTASREDFIESYGDKLFKVATPVSFGEKDNDTVADIRFTLDGVELLFSPNKGNQNDFTVSNIPITSITYKKESNQLLVRFTRTQIGATVRSKCDIEQQSNMFVKSIDCSEEYTDGIIILNLTDSAKFFTAKTKGLYEYKGTENSTDLPYLNLVFRPSDK